MEVGLLILRLIVGFLLFGHGTQKLFGWFGGHGVEGAGGMVESLGLRPGRWWAVVNGLAEAGGGVLLALGFLTPLGAAAIIGVMLVASLTVHLPHGIWSQNGGYELPLTNITAATTLAFAGPVSISVDAALGWGLAGVWWGLGALGLGLASGLLVTAIRRPEPPEARKEPEASTADREIA